MPFVAAASASASAPSGSTSPTSGSAAGTPEETAAAQRAAGSGKPVEVLSQRTEYDTVFANPNGTFTMESAVAPVRVRQGGKLVPTDATLQPTGNGTVRPKAIAVGLEFSAGGDAPLATITRDGRSMTVDWPGKLPAPVVEGDTATYPEVLPGVDLKMRASVGGFQQLLVVKNAEAAKNPALKTVTFDVAASGVALSTDEAGNLKAVNPAGQEVFTAPTPTMWDSAGIATGEAAPAAPAASPRFLKGGPRSLVAAPDTLTAAPDTTTAARELGGRPATPAEDVFEPRHGAVEKRMPIAVKGGEMALKPDASVLTSKDTVYPVYIDPTVSGARLNWTSVAKKYSTTSYWNHSSGVARVGYESDTGGTWRSMFTMDTKKLHGKQIIDSVFRIKNTHSWSCTKKPVELWRINPISSATTWAKQPSWVARVQTLTEAKGWGSGCPAGNLEFKTKSVADLAAANKWPTATLGLRASESDTYGWKKFDAKSAVFSTTYNTTPSTPSGLATSPATACTASPGTTVGNTDVQLSAKVADGDGGTVTARFKVWQTGTSTVLYEKTQAVTSGNIARVTVPKGSFVDGKQHSWQVRAEDGRASSAWSGVCRFHVDQNVPNHPPGISSKQFPDGDDGWPTQTGTARSEGVFTLSRGLATGVASYEYWTEWSPTVRTATPAAVDASVDVKLTPPVAGPLRVYARSLSKGGNRTAIQTYLFYANSPAMKDKPGDLNGDGTSDMYALRTTGELWMYAGNGNGTVGRYQEAGATNLAGASITHRGDWTGDGYEDLVAATGPKGSRQIQVFPNNGYGHACTAFGETAEGGDCADERRDLQVYEEPNNHFKNADQILAVGDVDGPTDLDGDGTIGEWDLPSYPDLLVKEGDHLWLYFGHASGYLDEYAEPVLVGNGSWSNYDIAAPGDRTGDGRVDMLARSRINGDLRLYTGTDAAGGGLGSGPAAIVIGTGWTVSHRPLITALPDGNGDGKTDIWSSGGDAKLYFYSDIKGSGTEVGTGGWQNFSALS
ncbi:FG-GAP repeat domain-containing protein [Streptomyces sp. NPDC090021]|uniref:FG-GAP repeat domain-containing protein n=1 Tax=Streptomyces sp. NPDC090021 TaxID=3365919 RepID=UPI00380D4471